MRGFDADQPPVNMPNYTDYAIWIVGDTRRQPATDPMPAYNRVASAVSVE